MIRLRILIGLAACALGCTTKGDPSTAPAGWTYSDELEYYGAKQYDYPQLAEQTSWHLYSLWLLAGFEEFAEELSSEFEKSPNWTLRLDLAPNEGVFSVVAVFENKNNGTELWAAWRNPDGEWLVVDRPITLNKELANSLVEKRRGLQNGSANNCYESVSSHSRIYYLTVSNFGELSRYSYYNPIYVNEECKYFVEYFDFMTSIAMSETDMPDD